MDYHSIHGHDVSSFDLPSTHRLPTVSAAQAHEDLSCNPFRFVSTGLDALDTLLAVPSGGLEGDVARGGGGVQKGLVTEVWGPPGVGKTAIGLQLASSALQDGRAVVWVDAFNTICPRRLSAFVDGKKCNPEALDKFVHFTCPSLPHLIALLCRPNSACIPPDASLVVIDSLSTLVNHAFPRTADPKAAVNKGNKGVPSPAARRQQSLQYVIGALQKLAATRNLAIVVLSQCATRMQVERGASLIPAVNASSWEEGVSTRIALFRDWSMQGGSPTAAHFAAVLKLDGKRVEDEDVELAAFEIGPNGVAAVALDHHGLPDSMALMPTAVKRSRKRGDTGYEIPDSDDDEDYGWQDEDAAALPPMPPQWQGSEDILLGHQSADSDEEGEPGSGSEEEECEKARTDGDSLQSDGYQ